MQYLIKNHTTLLFDAQVKRLCKFLPLKIYVNFTNDTTDV